MTREEFEVEPLPKIRRSKVQPIDLTDTLVETIGKPHEVQIRRDGHCRVVTIPASTCREYGVEIGDHYFFGVRREGASIIFVLKEKEKK